MKLNKLRLLVFLGISIILQACSTSRLSNTGIMSTDIEPTELTQKDMLAIDLGKVSVGDIVKELNDEQQAIREHEVQLEYTAATGGSCRQIQSKYVHSGHIESAIICNDQKYRRWYWPRQVVFE